MAGRVLRLLGRRTTSSFAPSPTTEEEPPNEAVEAQFWYRFFDQSPASPAAASALKALKAFLLTDQHVRIRTLAGMPNRDADPSRMSGH